MYTKGSLILTGLSPTADASQLIAYLEKRAKKIPSDKIPALLQNLPVVLSRNVAEETGKLVVRKLNELGAEARFVPIRSELTADELVAAMPLLQPSGAAAGAPAVVMPLPKRTRPAVRAERAQASIPLYLRYIDGLSAFLKDAGKKLWITAAMLGIALTINLAVASHSLLLGLYTVPTVISAYAFGRRWAMLTAFACIIMVGLVYHLHPGYSEWTNAAGPWCEDQLYHIVPWGCALLLTAYTMGTLHNRNKTKVREIRQTYRGLLLILDHVVAPEEERKNHSLRVAVYVTRIAAHLGFDSASIEDIRSAALLHDLGQMQLSRTILRKAASQWLGQGETPRKKAGDDTVDEHLLRGPMARILPLLIGTRTHPASKSAGQAQAAPLGTRILAVADAYDTLTFGDHGQEGVSPQEAHDIIVSKAGAEFDPMVVQAFSTAFSRMEMELPAIIL
ncbi:MAG: HD domain-containing protein [Proteobacteria bacterium]|nr:HD domain-containing protein [Pseudomonadota bacterium]